MNVEVRLRLSRAVREAARQRDGRTPSAAAFFVVSRRL